jgi:hypothetical protein
MVAEGDADLKQRQRCRPDREDLQDANNRQVIVISITNRQTKLAYHGRIVPRRFLSDKGILHPTPSITHTGEK